MNSVGLRPSYKTGFAQWSGMSEYPHLWTGLVGAWDMSLGQTGKKVFDLSGNGNAGAFTGDVIWVPGDSGPALDFLGTDDYVTLDKEVSFSSAVTIIIKAKADTFASNSSKAMVSLQKTTLTLFDNPPDTSLRWYPDVDLAAVDGNSTITGGIWYTFAVTQDALNNYALYQDGLSIGSGSTSALDFGSRGKHFGIFVTGVPTYVWDFDGQIEYVMVYNRALSASEIALLYQLIKRWA